MNNAAILILSQINWLSEIFMYITGRCETSILYVGVFYYVINETETIQNKEDLESTISSSQTFNSSKAKTSAAQEPKPMSQISGVRRDLSRIESVDTDIIHLPKYGVKTDRETELGEVLKVYMYYYITL